MKPPSTPINPPSARVDVQTGSGLPQDVGGLRGADLLFHRMGRRRRPHHPDGGRLQAHLRHEHLPGLSRSAGVFGAYFLLAIPAALINERFGYKAGLLTGVLLAAAGAIAFYPASKIMTYEAFLVALFAIAAGCSILETSANPYVLSLGPEETATRRLNFAQAFNPVGTNIGVLLAATLILPKLDEPVNMADLTPAQARAIRAGELGAVMGPISASDSC